MGVEVNGDKMDKMMVKIVEAARFDSWDELLVTAQKINGSGFRILYQREVDPVPQQISLIVVGKRIRVASMDEASNGFWATEEGGDLGRFSLKRLPDPEVRPVPFGISVNK